jgi:hypothetical protein
VFRVPERVAVQVPAVVTEAARDVGAASSQVPNMAKKTVVSAAVPPRLAKYHLALQQIPAAILVAQRLKR